jgi:hypothetical protein
MRARGISIIVVVACAVAAAAASAVWAITEPRPAFLKDDLALNQEGDPAKGRLVFAAGDCASCHALVGQLFCRRARSDRSRLRRRRACRDSPACVPPLGSSALLIYGYLNRVLCSIISKNDGKPPPKEITHTLATLAKSAKREDKLPLVRALRALEDVHQSFKEFSSTDSATNNDAFAADLKTVRHQTKRLRKRTTALAALRERTFNL